MRLLKRHWSAGYRIAGRPAPLCESHFGFRVVPDDQEIDCLRCLHYAGLYMPLSRLREHQESVRKIEAAARECARRRILVPLRTDAMTVRGWRPK